MSVRDAIANASKEALAAYLSPELCEQLVDEIVHRASAELEGAINTFVGFDVARATPRAARLTPSAKKGPGRKGRRAHAPHESSNERNGAENGQSSDEPSPEQMV